MAFLFRKFHEGIRVLAKSSTFAKIPRVLQFEADINRLFLYTSYNRLGRDAEEADIDEIVEMADKSPISDQEKQVHENIHTQIQTFCKSMDDILLDSTTKDVPAQEQNIATRRSGLSLAVGKTHSIKINPDIQDTKPLKLAEVSQCLKESIGYTVELKPSRIPHKDAGQGLFIDGEADVGTVIAFYPGVIYSPANYRYIPGYPRINIQNPYLITRYDGTIINAQPWGTGGETRQVWDGFKFSGSENPGAESGSDKIWKMLSKPLEGSKVGGSGEVLERRNPLALAHFANHPPKGVEPNVMVCSYDFPLNEKNMRTYIPNIAFGLGQDVNMKRFGSFWFKSGKSSNNGGEFPVLKTLVLVATRAICDEEALLNYRLSNSKRRPSWYAPVDEEEDRRRWS
jgi:hypothetical protein